MQFSALSTAIDLEQTGHAKKLHTAMRFCLRANSFSRVFPTVRTNCFVPSRPRDSKKRGRAQTGAEKPVEESDALIR